MDQEHQHIKALLKQDGNNLSTVNSYYLQSMRIINSHLMDFYNQYAYDNKLSLAQVSGSASHWDLIQYEQAVNELLNFNNPNDQLIAELKASRAKAQTNKRNTMNAIVGIGLSIATFKVQQYGNVEIPKQYIREHNYRAKGNTFTAPNNILNNHDFNDRIWSHNDGMINRGQNLINGLLNHGLNGNSIARLLNTLPQSANRLTNNLSSTANAMVSKIDLTFNVHSIGATNQGKDDAYTENHSNNSHEKWIGQRDDRECNICNDLDGEIFPQGQGPQPQIDTHYRCRCSRAESDKDGALSDVYPYY